MSELPLRAACEHGRYELHRLGVIGTPNRTRCLGGRVVTIDDLLEEAWQAGQASWPIQDARLHPDQFPQLAEVLLIQSE